MGRRFRNGPLIAAACWVIAAAIIAINASVAYQAAVLHLPEVCVGRRALRAGACCAAA